MEILFLTYNSSDSCSFYRSAGIAKDLRKKIAHNITVAQWPDINIGWSFINQYDIVYFQRPFTKDAAQLCEFIKHCGLKLWVDWDDNLFQVNPENKSYDIYNNPDIQRSMRQILSIADVVTVPTENLKTVLSSLNKSVEVIPNAFNDTLFERGQLSKRTNNVVWRGPESHIFDLSTFKGPINQATEEFPDWRFMFLGFSPWFLNGSDNKGYIPMQDIIQYHRALYEMAPACLHVPLADNPFNRCRSNVAYIEISFAGGVAICPAWWDVPGSLSYTDQDSYFTALKSVLNGDVDIVAQNRIAWKYIQNELALSKINLLRKEIIESLLY